MTSRLERLETNLVVNRDDSEYEKYAAARARAKRERTQEEKVASLEKRIYMLEERLARMEGIVIGG